MFNKKTIISLSVFMLCTYQYPVFADNTTSAKMDNNGLAHRVASLEAQVTALAEAQEQLLDALDNLNLQSEIPEPDYDSGWFIMQSNSGAGTYKELAHNLGVYPSIVKAEVRAIDGANEGFIFDGLGSAHTDDDVRYHQYGGVVYAYDDNSVRIWAPNRNNGPGADGRMVFIGDGWGPGINGQLSQTAEVRVLVWK